MCNKKIYNKIKCYESKINKNFYDNKIPKKALIAFVYYQYFLILFLNGQKLLSKGILRKMQIHYQRKKNKQIS